MLGLGDTLLSAVLRIAGTVAVLAAVYFFIVKPVLHTTETVSRSVQHSQNQAFRQSRANQRQVQRTVRQAQRRANRAFRQAGVRAHRATVQAQKAVKGQTNVSGLPKRAQRVIRCLQHANGDVAKLQACQ
jgi:F0F1-type ATP synthase membrane subunit b/b'